MTWSPVVACSRLLQRQRGRHDRRWSCATTVERVTMLSMKIAGVHATQCRQPVVAHWRGRHVELWIGINLCTSQRTCVVLLTPKITHRPHCTDTVHLRCLTCGYVIGESFLSRSLSIVSLSSRRSNLVPTSTMGVAGQWWLTSGNHCTEHTRSQLKARH